MTISKDLFLAILSLDSYNRGYHSGISDEGQDDTDGLGEVVQIGLATSKKNSGLLLDDNGNRLDQAAGFYAISYKIDDGSKITGLNTNFNLGDTIIAYRGTDDPKSAGSNTMQ